MIIQEQEWKVIMMTNPKYTLQILRNRYLKSFDPKFNMTKYNLGVFNSDKPIFNTNNKIKIKMYINLLGIKSDSKYQKTQIAGYLFYD